MRKGNNNLEILCWLTAIAADVEDDVLTEILSSLDGWIKIVDLWDRLLEGGSEGIFEEASHRIMWGIPCEHRRSPYDDIIELVIKEMLLDGDAFSAWSTLEVFENSVGYISGEVDPDIDATYRYSIFHYEYLSAQLWYKVFFSKHGYIEKGNYYQDRISAYESAIKKIVPAAKNWEDCYWCDENHILDEIDRLYGVDYRHLDYIEYDRLLLMLTHSSDDIEMDAIHEAWCASNIKALPVKLAEAIWPEYTEERACIMFLLSAKEADKQAHDSEIIAEKRQNYIHPVGVFDHRSIFESWLYPFVDRLNQDPEQYSALIKERLFTVAINS